VISHQGLFVAKKCILTTPSLLSKATRRGEESRLRLWPDHDRAQTGVKGSMWLDRRKDYPGNLAELGVSRERPVPASMLAPMRRVPADSVAQERASSVALARDLFSPAEAIRKSIGITGEKLLRYMLAKGIAKGFHSFDSHPNCL
jgi:hypothetical protein